MAGRKTFHFYHLDWDTEAHAGFPTGNFHHYNDDFRFTDGSTPELCSLLWVAMHEFGHSLGIPHSTSLSAVMYAIYRHPDEHELQGDDIDATRALYGRCTIIYCDDVSVVIMYR